MPANILIVDSLASNRILLNARLTQAHYRVSLAEGWGEAMAFARAGRFDLVLLGLPMAGKAGAQALEPIAALKADPATGAPAVIVLSTLPDRSLRRAALEAGADDVLDRRGDPMILLARIRGLMRARYSEAELGLRGDAQAALGFAEAAPAFEGPGLIALISRRPETGAAWKAGLAPLLRDRIEVIPYQRLLDSAEAIGAPDVYVIEADLAGRHDGLAAIAELRSRAGGRTAGIVAVLAEGEGEGVVSALDLGADDALAHPIDAFELVLRLRAQLRRKARADGLRRQLSDGLRLAVTDPLTGLYNRRYAQVQMARIGAASAATSRPFAVMVLDLDRFKRVNDDHGHAAGDAALIEAARRIAAALRAEDLVARLGGEEFLVAMPDTGAEAARSAAERLRRVIEEAPFAVAEGVPPLDLTVSIGVAIGDPLAEGAVEAAMDVADRALYDAKAEGRNLVAMGRPAA